MIERAKILIGIILATIAQPGAVIAAQSEAQLAWGINAVSLKTPWSEAPSLDALLSDQDHTVVLDKFYRTGGTPRPATPTEFRLARTSEALFVVFRCMEPAMSFPASEETYPNTNRAASWRQTAGSPGGSDSWPPLPDEVDLFIQPDIANPTNYQFATTPDGLKLGRERILKLNSGVVPDSLGGRGSPVPGARIDSFEVSVTKKAGEWDVLFIIPWTTIGGEPKSHFGFLPERTRFRDGEYSSPVAIDFSEVMPLDLMIEAYMDGTVVQPPRTTLFQLPSGIYRWQMPVIKPYPDVATRQDIWQLESQLSTATDMDSLGRRLYLTQSWMDLLNMEGWVAQPRVSSVWTNDLTLKLLRQRINIAFQKNDIPGACKTLDNNLRLLDGISRWWYADETPGDISTEAWEPVAEADQFEVKDNVLYMQGRTGRHTMGLHLALPKTGGVRFFGSKEGFFKPEALLPLKPSRSQGTWAVATPNGKVVIRQKPFSVSFYGMAGKPVTQIGAGNLAFRFASDGKVLAMDYKNRLDADEVIYGFGERYDRFNENGSALTLWGSDDWLGNGQGLRNTTYKPLPIFHSSRGYMAFDNSSYRLRADVGATEPGVMRVTQQGPIFDWYFWIGPPEKSLHDYTALTGRVPLPPKWVFDPWMGRGGGGWASGPEGNAELEEEDTCNRFASLDIPHSAIYAEGNPTDPVLNKFMAARHIKVLGYFMPAVFEQRRRASRQEALTAGMKPEDVPVLHCDNTNETAGLGYVDFTHPKAKEFMRRVLKRALDAGVAGSMVDFGDMVPDDAVFHDGRRGDEMHNCYSYDYHRMVSELYRERRGDDFILYGRAAAPGGQRWVGQFAGDHPSNFDGLRAVLTGALNLCACGFSTWGSDLGGYFGLPEPAVYMRWIQFGCFSPIWRPHGKATRDPWFFGDAAVTNYKFMAWTRENILPYTYNAAVIAHETGVPIMRSMPIAFPNEPAVAAVRDQYMFGPDLLVAPVLNEDDHRAIQFPAQTWTCLWDGKTVAGPASLDESAPLDTIPVYLKEGALMPVHLSRQLQFGDSMTGGQVNALVVTPSRATRMASWVNDDGTPARASVESSSRGCTWKIEGASAASYLLVYGTSASNGGVRVNGSLAPKIELANLQTASSGWCEDASCNRLIIRVPSQDKVKIEVIHSEGK